MKKTLFLFLTLFLQLTFVKSQEWFKYAEFPVNVIPKDIASNNAGTMFLLTTENSLFYKTLGGNWIKMDTSAAFNINCISADINNNKIYVGTLNGGLFHTSNFGTSWNSTFLFTNPHTGMHEGYNLISNIRNSNLFFATNVGVNQLARFTNNGTTGQMRTVSSDTSFGILDLYYTTSNELLVGSNQGLMKSDDGGNTFISLGHSQSSLFDFTEDEDGRVYVLAINNSSNEYMLWRSDPANYHVWTEVNLPDESTSFTTVYYDKSSSQLWLAGENSIYSSSIEGLNWQNSNQNLSNPKIVEFIDNNNGDFYSFTINENCIATESGSWVDSNNGLSGEIHSISFGDNNKLFSYNNYYSNKLSSLEASSGQWQNQSIGTFITGLRGFIKYDNDVLIARIWNKIFASGDNGETFSEMNLPSEIQAQTSGGIDILKKGEQGSLLVTHTFIQNKVFISENLGESWNVIENLIDNSIDISQDSDGNLFAVLWGANTVFVPELYYSTDNGNSWNQIDDQIFTFSSNDPKLISKNNKTYLQAEGKVFKINLTEGSLEEIDLPFAATQFMDLQFTVNDLGEFFLTDSNFNLYKSVDGGLSWDNLQKPNGIPNGLITSIDFGFDHTPFIIYRKGNAFNQNQGIYYFRDEQIMNTSENSLAYNSLIYPNPVSNSVYVETDFRGKIKLFDFSGKILLEKTITENKTLLNLNNLTAGVYILKFENGESYKIIKK